MTRAETPGSLLRKAVAENNPLQVVGTVNAYSAIMAEKAGHQAIYLSGGGVAACSMGIPDLGITTLKDVLEDVWRITAVSSLPLLVVLAAGAGCLVGMLLYATLADGLVRQVLSGPRRRGAETVDALFEVLLTAARG